MSTTEDWVEDPRILVLPEWMFDENGVLPVDPEDQDTEDDEGEERYARV